MEEMHELTEQDKKDIRSGMIQLRPVVMWFAKWPDGTVKVLQGKDVTKMMMEDFVFAEEPNEETVFM